VRFPWLICCLAVLAVPAHAELCKTKNLMPEYFAFEAKTAAMTPEQLGRLSALVRSRQRLSSAGNSAARGYFMGLRMAEELGQTRSLQQLAHLQPAQVRPLARAFLQEQIR
jgi:hypothetical protein